MICEGCLSRRPHLLYIYKTVLCCFLLLLWKGAVAWELILKNTYNLKTLFYFIFYFILFPHSVCFSCKSWSARSFSAVKQTQNLLWRWLIQLTESCTETSQKEGKWQKRKLCNLISKQVSREDNHQGVSSKTQGFPVPNAAQESAGLAVDILPLLIWRESPAQSP